MSIICNNCGSWNWKFWRAHCLPAEKPLNLKYDPTPEPSVVPLRRGYSPVVERNHRIVRQAFPPPSGPARYIVRGSQADADPYPVLDYLTHVAPIPEPERIVHYVSEDEDRFRGFGGGDTGGAGASSSWESPSSCESTSSSYDSGPSDFGSSYDSGGSCDTGSFSID